ncbi:exo-alpha-sialidase [Micromonospora sp. NPDC092111]|uniref:sialidase family protein n=1 Tax=Micromonospora sp. NPDC092111 TaxID=3364289 RepID=UPI00382A403D
MSAAAPLVADGVLRDRPDGLGEAVLPTRTVQAHAANLAVLPGGDLGCVWFGGTQEGVADVCVWFSRLPAGADRWSDPVRLSDDGTRSEQNPVLFGTPAGELWLLHTAQHAGDQDTAVVRARVSADGGATWGPARELLASPQGGLFVRQPPVVLPSGRWLLPTFTCPRLPGHRWVGDHDTSSVWFSDDAGATWRETPVPGSTGRVHMNIVPRAGGGYAAYFRSRWADHVYRSGSPDGVTWEPPQATALPNNNSSIQAVALGDGRVVLVGNGSSRRDAVARRISLYDEIDDHGIVDGAGPQVRPVDPGTVGDDADGRTAFWGAPRAPLVLAVSPDDGVSWPVRWVLADGDGYALSNNSRDGVNRELSYPSVVVDGAGELHVAFTHHRQAIRHLRIPVRSVLDRLGHHRVDGGSATAG